MSPELAIWCSAYGAAYVREVDRRMSEGRDPLLETGDVEEAVAIADSAVEDFRGLSPKVPS